MEHTVDLENIDALFRARMAIYTNEVQTVSSRYTTNH